MIRYARTPPTELLFVSLFTYRFVKNNECHDEARFFTICGLPGSTPDMLKAAFGSKMGCDHTATLPQPYHRAIFRTAPCQPPDPRLVSRPGMALCSTCGGLVVDSGHILEPFGSKMRCDPTATLTQPYHRGISDRLTRLGLLGGRVPGSKMGCDPTATLPQRHFRSAD